MNGGGIPDPEPARADGLREAYQRAVGLHRQGQLNAAQDLYRQVLEVHEEDSAALHMLGMALLQAGQTDAGMEYVRRSLAISPRLAPAWSTLGNALRALRRPLEALEQYDRALKIDPRYAPALNNRGSALLDLGRAQEAAESYRRALQLRPDHVDTLVHYGHALAQLDQPQEALLSYDRALRLRPNSAAALFARATLLRRLRSSEEALRTLDLFLGLEPGHVEAHHDRGSVLADMNRLEEAIQSYDRALELDPTCKTALFNRAVALARLQRFELAAASYARLLAIDPRFPFAAGALLQLKMMLCDWTDFGADCERVLAGIEEGRAPIIPFALLAITDCPARHLRLAGAYARELFPVAAASVRTGRCYQHDRIRVAYLSADFREHPVAMLLTATIERHDRSAFEILLVSLQARDDSALCKRLIAAADRFLDVSRASDGAVAAMLGQLEVDIVVDLQGFTDGARTGILARRAAPIQVNYLGFPASMGTGYLDYIIGDATVIPAGTEAEYAERIVRLPHCYLPFDAGQEVATQTPSRAELGLPAEGFVFCAFNTHYKITPPLFDIWMRLLVAVPGSCLWLRAGNVALMDNLRREAARRDVDPQRLVFAPRLAGLEEHLARHRRADLFLDTLPYGAHATAAFALWAGLPVLTCLGGAFAGRVAASLLRALGLPQLIASDMSDYEQRALELAHDPRRLAALRAALEQRRAGASPFDTDRYRRALETAFRAMHQRHLRGEPAADITVPEAT